MGERTGTSRGCGNCGRLSESYSEGSDTKLCHQQGVSDSELLICGKYVQSNRNASHADARQRQSGHLLALFRECFLFFISDMPL